MKLILLSDVHGNLEALDAVLHDARQFAPGGQLVCAGDIVGYGPDPEACIERLRARGAICVRGNHEEMVLELRDLSSCVHAGIVAAVWTRERALSPAARRFIAGLPRWLVIADADVAICHGDLVDAGRYVSDARAADAALAQLEEMAPSARLLVCGHTHHAALYDASRGYQRIGGPSRHSLAGKREGKRTLVNPGAVGQARDRREGPAARYAIVDLEKEAVTFRAVRYPHQVTRRKMRRAGLVDRVMLVPPGPLARRVEGWKSALARRWAEARGARPERSVERR